MSFFRVILIFLASLNISNTFSNDFIQNIRLSDNNNNKITRIVLDLSEKLPYTAFILNNKPRLVIDIEASGYTGKSIKNSKLVRSIRFRKTEKGVIRIVFDLTKKSYILKNFYLKKNKNQIHRLVIDIKEVSNKNKIAIKSKTNNQKKFVITIDPGHGGIDPGAINLGTKEKNLTLKASIELKKLLTKKGFKVYLTRNKDIFLSLRQRRHISKKNKSDLFISLHVDSVKRKSTRGTSIYTLSEKASDKITAKLAERENKVDLIAGINLDQVDNEVASILLDLTRRDTKNSSSLFAENYIEKARKNGHRLLRRPHRHAGFAVLKSPDIPSVLIELGFLSNSKDVQLLKNSKSRKRLLITLAESIEQYAKLRKKGLN